MISSEALGDGRDHRSHDGVEWLSIGKARAETKVPGQTWSCDVSSEDRFE